MLAQKDILEDASRRRYKAKKEREKEVAAEGCTS